MNADLRWLLRLGAEHFEHESAGGYAVPNGCRRLGNGFRRRAVGGPADGFTGDFLELLHRRDHAAVDQLLREGHQIRRAAELRDRRAALLGGEKFLLGAEAEEPAKVGVHAGWTAGSCARSVAEPSAKDV
ncbi:MAG: hypothetical protein RJB55_1251 [Verrucomicrobiota bacterium]